LHLFLLLQNRRLCFARHQYLLSPLPQGNAHANLQVPYPMQRVHVSCAKPFSCTRPFFMRHVMTPTHLPPESSPGTYLTTSTPTATPACPPSTHVTTCSSHDLVVTS